MDKQAEVTDGGYDYQFVETPPDILICKICHFPSREPCPSEYCGHTFYKLCIDHVKKATVLYPCLCPVCRSKQFTVFCNKQNERVIKSLHVYCSNKKAVNGKENSTKLMTILKIAMAVPLKKLSAITTVKSFCSENI